MKARELIEQLLKGDLDAEVTSAPPTVGNAVIVRTYSAGVHFGTMTSQSADGKRVELVNSRRIWSWKGANTLSEIALHGVGEGSRVAEPVSITLTEAIEIISCSPKAVKNIEAVKWPK